LITITKWTEYQQKEPQTAPQEHHKGTAEEPIKEVKKLRSKETTPTNGDNLSLPELKKIYSETFRDLLPTKLILDRLQWMIDNFSKAEILARFEGAASAKAKTLNYVTAGLEKELKNNDGLKTVSKERQDQIAAREKELGLA